MARHNTGKDIEDSCHAEFLSCQRKLASSLANRTKLNLFSSFIILLIRFYRFAISMLLGNCCRFEPTCSTYAMEAIKTYGCLKGCRLALQRLLRCHPWHAGGIDSVP